MDVKEFQQLVRPGVPIQFRSDGGATFVSRVASCNWRRGYVKVHMPLRRNPQKVPAWAIDDVPPNREDIDSVEEWLARGPFVNPYQRPLRGPMVSFYVAPDGQVSMSGNTDRSAPDAPDSLFRRAQASGMFDRGNRNYLGVELGQLAPHQERILKDLP